MLIKKHIFHKKTSQGNLLGASSIKSNKKATKHFFIKKHIIAPNFTLPFLDDPLFDSEHNREQFIYLNHCKTYDILLKHFCFKKRKLNFLQVFGKTTAFLKKKKVLSTLHLLYPKLYNHYSNLKLVLNSTVIKDIINSINLIECYLNNLSCFLTHKVEFKFNALNAIRGHWSIYKTYYPLKNSLKQSYDQMHFKQLFIKISQQLNTTIFSGTIQKLPQSTKVFTVTRAPFVFKKTSEQFGYTKRSYHLRVKIRSKIHLQLLFQLLGLLKLPSELKTISII